MSTKLPLSLVIFGKDNEDSLAICIASVYALTSEIIYVDTGSRTGAAIDIARNFGARVYGIGFSDFGNIRSLTAHLACQDWVLGLDTDEIIAPEDLGKIEGLIKVEDVDVYGLPRRRWSDLRRSQQVEVEAYPDWQYRLFRNKPDAIRWDNRVHERLVVKTGTRVMTATEGPHIEHFQDVFKKDQRLAERNRLYRRLYNADIASGVIHTIPPVVDLDEEEKDD